MMPQHPCHHHHPQIPNAELQSCSGPASCESRPMFFMKSLQSTGLFFRHLPAQCHDIRGIHRVTTSPDPRIPARTSKFITSIPQTDWQARLEGLSSFCGFLRDDLAAPSCYAICITASQRSTAEAAWAMTSSGGCPSCCSSFSMRCTWLRS